MVDFRKEILKVSEKRNITISNSRGIKEAWLWLKKNKWPIVEEEITELQLGRVVRLINTALQEKILKGESIRLPFGMGKILLASYNSRLELDKNNKLVTTIPIDWGETLKEWERDSEAYNKKTLIRFNGLKRYKLLYDKSFCFYKNKIFYRFTPSRELKNRISKRAKENNIDTLSITKNHGIYKH